MPSRRHEFLATAIPRLRKAGDLESEPIERARVEALHRSRRVELPTRAVPRFGKRFSVVTEDLGFPSYVITPRHLEPTRTLYYVHGGAFMAGIDAFQVRHATQLASRIGARVVMPDYPLAPEHTWRDSHDALVEQAGRFADRAGGMVLAGDSSGGGLALAVALSMRDRGLTPATHLVLHAPWVDLTTSTPETRGLDALDPWLFYSKLTVYAEWWAGSAADLGRPEVSPALADLHGLPRALQLFGSRDLLAPGCRLLAKRAADAGWDLSSVEEPELIHVYGVLPFIPEGRRAMRQIVEFVS
jgi:monoterpene epsilon-lactone hydrolase